MASTTALRRALAEGLASWLEFEQHCARYGLFSERYLALPVAQILSAQTGGIVQAEHNHPVLAIPGRPGRPPQLDFVVSEAGAVRFVVETKWIATRAVSAAEVLWDCVRLELAAHHYQCEALFVLAGEHGRVQDVLKLGAFNPPNSRGRPSLLLGVNGVGRMSVNIESPTRDYGPKLHAILRGYPGVRYPHTFVCGSGVQYPVKASRTRYSATVWAIRPETSVAAPGKPPKRRTFLP